MHPSFRHHTLRNVRAGMYAFLGGSSLIAVTHGVALHGLETQNKRMSLDWMVVMALFNFAGAFTYALRVSTDVE